MLRTWRTRAVVTILLAALAVVLWAPSPPLAALLLAGSVALTVLTARTEEGRPGAAWRWAFVVAAISLSLWVVVLLVFSVTVPDLD